MRQAALFGIVKWAALAYILCATRLFADEAHDQFAVAAGHYAAGRWDLAADEFSQFLQAHPEHPRRDQVSFYLGEALVQSGRFEEARRQYRALLERDPQGEFARMARYRSGECAYLADDLAGAREEFAEFYRVRPEDPLVANVLPYLGELTLETGDAALAEELLTQALRKYPNSAMRQEARFHLARAQVEQGRSKEAEELYRTLAGDPQHPLAERAQFELGLLLYQAGRDDDAERAWTTLLEKYPNSKLRPRAELGLAWIFYRQAKYAQAHERLAGLVDDKKLGVEARYWLGLALRGEQNWSAAAEAFLAAQKQSPPAELTAALHFYAGDSLLKAGDIDAAGAQFDAGMQASSGDRWAEECLYGKLQIALRAKKHEEVERLAGDYLAKHPKGSSAAEVHLVRAAARIALDRHSDAAEDLRQYLKTHGDAPAAAGAWAELAICAAKTKQWDEAKDAYRRMVEKRAKPEVALPTTHHLAEAAYAAGDREWAAELFESMASAGNPPEYVAKGLSGLAWSKLKSEDVQSSTALFQRLIEEHPDSPLAPEAALARGQMFEQRSEADPALAMYLLIVDKYPESREAPEAMLRAARLHDKLQQNEQSAARFRALIEKHPEFPQRDAALYGLAWVSRELGQKDDAQQAFAQLNRDFPQSIYWADATYRLAQQAVEEKRYDEAKTLLDALLAASPKSDVLVHALYLQGRIATLQADWAAVDPPLERLLREFPESPLRLPAEFSLAEAAYRRDDLKLASDRFAALAREAEGRDEPWLAMAPLRQAQILSRQNQWRSALEQAETIAQRFPAFERQYEADYLIGRAHAAMAEFDAARAAYEAVVRSPQGGKTETAAMAQWMIGETYFHQKDFEQARKEYLRTEILYAYPEWQAAALLQAGKCQESLAQWSEAAETYLQLLKKYPDTTYTEDARRRLKIAQQRADEAE